MTMLNLDILEPITKDNLHELQPGEWIWDNLPIERGAHKKSMVYEAITEPIGFRQIDILDFNLYPNYSRHPFMLSTIDKFYNNTEWAAFEEGRYFKFKKGQHYDKG